jgi:hypothetical protein
MEVVVCPVVSDGEQAIARGAESGIAGRHCSSKQVKRISTVPPVDENFSSLETEFDYPASITGRS